MKANGIIAAGVVAAACALAVVRWRAAQIEVSRPVPMRPPVVAEAPVSHLEEPPISEAAAPDTVAPPENPPPAGVKPAPIPKPAVVAGPAPANGRELQDPDARAALGLVGMDPDAEAYWVGAINDPDLSEHERKDLIEDLNEEGFEDPKNLTTGDLPLIVNRLQIIEDLMPEAMDRVNAEAFAEARKDLWNMYLRLAQQ